MQIKSLWIIQKHNKLISLIRAHACDTAQPSQIAGQQPIEEIEATLQISRSEPSGVEADLRRCVDLIPEPIGWISSQRGIGDHLDCRQPHRCAGGQSIAQIDNRLREHLQAEAAPHRIQQHTLARPVDQQRAPALQQGLDRKPIRGGCGHRSNDQAETIYTLPRCPWPD